MKIRKDDRLIGGDCHAEPGDRVQLHYTEVIEYPDGRVEVQDNIVLDEEIDKEMVFTHGVILESEDGEFDANYGLGGMFLNREGR